jgi:hypothetical protein
MANIVIEQYRLVGRDGSTRIQIPGVLMPGGSEVLDGTTGDTVALLPDCNYIYVYAELDSWGGFTNDPDDLDNSAPLENDRHHLPETFIRFISVPNGATHFSVKEI